MTAEEPQSNQDSLPTLRVRAALPHFYREHPGGTGYGSGREGQRLARSVALARCIGALQALQRSDQDLVLNIGRRWLDSTPGAEAASVPLPPLTIDVHVFTDGEHVLEEVFQSLVRGVTVHQLRLDDPRQLPLEARDYLIRAEPDTDLSLYLEDDLVIGDPLFLDKQHWFLQGCEHRAVLMPHRYEPIPGRRGQRLLVDGPLRDGFIGRFTQPRQDVGRGRFRGGAEVRFDRTANPHSGLFCLSQSQVRQLRTQTLPRDGFISPLETAATLTVLQSFAVLKPGLAQRDFLWVEHGHPSFTSYADLWPLASDQQGPNPLDTVAATAAGAESA